MTHKKTGKGQSKQESKATRAELRKLALMRQASSGAGNTLNSTGAKKLRGPKPKAVTLPSAATLRKLEEK